MIATNFVNSYPFASFLIVIAGLNALGIAWVMGAYRLRTPKKGE